MAGPGSDRRELFWLHFRSHLAWVAFLSSVLASQASSSPNFIDGLTRGLEPAGFKESGVAVSKPVQAGLIPVPQQKELSCHCRYFTA